MRVRDTNRRGMRSAQTRRPQHCHLRGSVRVRGRVRVRIRVGVRVRGLVDRLHRERDLVRVQVAVDGVDRRGEAREDPRVGEEVETERGRAC